MCFLSIGVLVSCNLILCLPATFTSFSSCYEPPFPFPSLSLVHSCSLTCACAGASPPSLRLSTFLFPCLSSCDLQFLHSCVMGLALSVDALFRSVSAGPLVSVLLSGCISLKCLLSFFLLPLTRPFASFSFPLYLFNIYIYVLSI